MNNTWEEFKLDFYKQTDELIGGTFKDHVRDAVWQMVEDNVHSLLKEQREICAKKASAFSRGYGVTKNFMDNQADAILNAPEPTGVM